MRSARPHLNALERTGLGDLVQERAGKGAWQDHRDGAIDVEVRERVDGGLGNLIVRYRVVPID